MLVSCLLLLPMAVSCLAVGDSPAAPMMTDDSACPPCDLRLCQTVSPDDCEGTVVKDNCSCCPICQHTPKHEYGFFEEEENGSISYANASHKELCAKIKCSRTETCTINIQDIPQCRCPSKFYCRNRNQKDVCGEDGQTYRSRCYLRMKECEENVRVRIASEGPCMKKARVNGGGGGGGRGGGGGGRGGGGGGGGKKKLQRQEAREKLRAERREEKKKDRRKEKKKKKVASKREERKEEKQMQKEQKKAMRRKEQKSKVEDGLLGMSIRNKDRDTVMQGSSLRKKDRDDPRPRPKSERKKPDNKKNQQKRRRQRRRLRRRSKNGKPLKSQKTRRGKKKRGKRSCIDSKKNA